MATTDAVTFLLQAMEENYIHAKLSEEKRATIAHIVLILATLLQALLSFLGFHRTVLPLTITLILLGAYGVVSGLKLYERSHYHIARARKLRARLDELCPEAQVEPLQKMAEIEHQKQYPIFMKVRLNAIWLGLHSVVIILGCIYTVICLFWGAT